MIWIIPMAGKGIRTRKLGEFKPFIEVKGHKMLSWFISSIKDQIDPKDKLILITTKYFSKKFNFELEVKKIFQYHDLENQVIFISCEETPKGTSDTVLLANKHINIKEPVIIINPDQYTSFKLPEIKENSGYLGLYIQLGNKSGFVKIKNKKITKFVEKRNISNVASSGIYIVSSGEKLIKAIIKQIKRKENLNGEFYIGQSFNHLIKTGISVYPFAVISKYDLGNLEDIKYFSKRSFIC
jgi:NDP-sugar pyrophosphorylase family protein